MSGNFGDIPADVLIRNYSALKKIHIDNVIPIPVEKEVFVYWGRTGSGKSKRAWEEATFFAYSKSPTLIWWCGYQQHEAVVIELGLYIDFSELFDGIHRLPDEC
jgi:hypothetical protein